MNNRFERGQEAKKALEVGLNAATFDLESILIIRYNKLPSRVRLTEKACHSVLKEIQKNPKQFFQRCKENKRDFGFVRYGENDSQWIAESLSGELVRFKNNLYLIPKL
jgi:hypothetical protein